MIDVGIYSGDGPFSSNIPTVNLDPYKGTHWVININENLIDSYDCAPPQKLSKFIMKRNGHCFYSQYKIQGVNSFGASYCLYIIYLRKI